MQIGKEQLIKAIRFLLKSNIDGWVDDISFHNLGISFDEYWPEITDKSEVYINFKDADDSPNMSIAQLISIADKLINARFDYNIGAAVSNSEF